MTDYPNTDNVPKTPLTGREPQWLRDLPQDNIVSAFFMCVVEIARLRDEQSQFRKALIANGIDVENREAPISLEERAAIDKEVSNPIVERVMGELFRTQAGWTDVDPRVSNFFEQPSK